MATDPDLERTIAEQEAILNAGVQQTSVDGVSITYNLDELRRKLTENRATLAGTRKRTLSGIRLDG